MNESRRDRFNSHDGKKFDQIDNELEMVFNAHNDHDAGRKGWNYINLVSGTNKRMGTATLVGGTVTVSNTTVTASTKVFLSRHTTGGTAGHLSVGTVVASTSFIINSSSGTDTSTVNWLLVEPK